MGKFGRSWDLAKASLAVLLDDPAIMGFSFFSWIVGVIILSPLAGLAIAAALGTEVPWIQDLWNSIRQMRGAGIVVLAVAFFALIFTQTFFMTGLATVAHSRFSGRTSSFSDGFVNAISRLDKILFWSLLSTGVSVIFGMLKKESEDNGSKIGEIATAAGEFSWGVATTFMVPVIALEELSVLDSVKKATAILRKTWGESAIVAVSGALFMKLIGTFGHVAFLLIFLILARSAHGVSGLALIISFLLFSVFLWAVNYLIWSTLDAILMVALYEYATTGKVPEGFTTEEIQNAMSAHQSRRRLPR